MDKVSYYEHESVLAKMERANRRVWILCLLLIFALVGTNVGWIYYNSLYENNTTTITQEVDSSGGSAMINDGVHYNGESETDGNN